MVSSLMALWVLFVSAEGPPAAELPPSDFTLTCLVAPLGTVSRPQSCLTLIHPKGRELTLCLSRRRASVQVRGGEDGRGSSPIWPLPKARSPSRRVHLRRTGDRLQLAVDGVIVGELAGLDGRGGEVAGLGDSWAVRDLRIQPLAEIVFSDDFMREEGNLGEWEILSGEWTIQAMDHPDLSASPFCLEGRADGRGAIVAGYDFWDGYVFQAALRLESVSGAMGLAFHGGDGENFHLVRWSGSRAKRRSGRLSVLRVREGKRR